MIKANYHGAFTKKLIAGTGGYGILFRSTVYDLLINELSKEKDLADICYMKNMSKMNCFRTTLNLVLHNDGYSTIQKKHVSYPKLSRVS